MNTSEATQQLELRRAVDELLREGKAGAEERERTAFDRIAAPYESSVVLFGAGGLGRRTLTGLRSVGIEPIAFCDNNARLWGTSIQGLQVLSPEDAARRYGDKATFVVTIWTAFGQDRMGDREGQLRELGCQRVVSFGPLYWKYAEVFLPHYTADSAHLIYDQADAVRSACNLWSDERSRREYLAQLRWRLLFDFDGLSQATDDPQYFPAELCPLVADEMFVDCGAFDGDTVRSFLEQPKPGFRRVFAFEPDSSNFARLAEFAATCGFGDRIGCRQAAVGRDRGIVKFCASGTAASAVGFGDSAAECVALDEVFSAELPTYIKMDIEGSELDALAGARGLIERHAPVLGICSYHRQDHLWRVPQLIQSYNSTYRFFLRPYREVWDLVCYAIPPGRLRRI